MARTVQPIRKDPRKERTRIGRRGAKKPESRVPMGRFGDTPSIKRPPQLENMDRSQDGQAGIDGDCTGIQNV